MAEELLYDYLYDEIELSGDLIPCEFCNDLFPFSIFIEHESGCTLNPLNQKPEAPSEAESHKESVLKASPVEENVKESVLKASPSVKESVLKAAPVKENVVIKIEHMVANQVYNFKSNVLKKVLDSDDQLSENSKQYITYKDQDDSGTDEETSVASPECPQPVTEVELSDDDNEENITIEGYLFKAYFELNKIKRGLTGARPKYENLHSKNFDDQRETICSPHQNFNYCF